MSDQQHPFAPPVYHDRVGEALKNVPYISPQLTPAAGTDGDGTAIHHTTRNDVIRQVLGQQKVPVYAWDQTAPLSVAQPFMEGFGHSGYVGATSADFNAVRQSMGSKWLNGFAKGVGNALSTFVSGTVGLADGLGEMIASPVRDGEFRFSRFYDNFTDQQMQHLQDWQERVFPNFRTQKETDASFWSSDNWATANFWADGFLKNLGFAAGALASGWVAGGVLAKVPQITEWAIAARRGLSSGDFGLKAIEMERALSVLGEVDDVTRSNVIREIAGVTSKGLEKTGLGMSADRLAQVANKQQAWGSAFNNGFTSTMGAIGESSMEAIEGKRKIKEDLIQEYRDAHYGEEPDGNTMNEIEKRSAEGANWRWWFNLMTLSVTNNIQFPRLLGNGVKNQTGTFELEVNDILAVTAEDKATGRTVARTWDGEKYAEAGAVKAAERSKAMKIINPVWQFIKNPIALSESVEEGLQYTYEVGTESYEQKKYDHQSTNLVKELLFTGLPATFHNKEGIESMVFGGLSGKLMDVALGGRERRTKAKNTSDMLDVLNDNENKITTQLGRDATYENAVRKSNSPFIDEVNIGNIQFQATVDENNKAVAKKDVNKMRSHDEDFLFTLAKPRIKYGRKDLFKEELRQFHSSNMPFEEARKALSLTEGVTSQDLDNSIERRVKQVDRIATLHEFVMGTHGIINPVSKLPKYVPETLDNMLYSLFKIDMHEERYDQLVNQIQDASGVDLSPLTEYYMRRREGTTKEGMEGYRDLDTIRNEVANHIKKVEKAARANPKSASDDNGISLISKLHDLETIQNDREKYVKDYHRYREMTTDVIEKLVDHPDSIANQQDLEIYEELNQYKLLVGQLQQSTIARNLALKMTESLEKLDDNDISGAINKLAEVERLTTSPQNFLYKDSIKFLTDIIDKIRNKAVSKAVAATGEASPIPGLDQMSAKDFTALTNNIKDKVDEASAEFYSGTPQSGPYSLEQLEYLEKARSEYDKIIEPLAKTDSIIRRLNTGEPVTPPVSQLKRKIADSFMEKYDSIKEVVNNPDYSEVEDVEQLLKRLKDMKEWYKERHELLSTKAFKEQRDPFTGKITSKPFMEILDERIAEVQSWLDKVKKRAEDILKDDVAYYRAKVTDQWKALGINPAAAVVAPVKQPEPDEEIKKKIAALEEEKKKAVDAAVTDDDKARIAAEYDAKITALTPVAPAPAAIAGTHIYNKAVYDAVVAILGEDKVLAALHVFQKEYKAHLTDPKQHPDYQKYVLGLVEGLKKAPVSINLTVIQDTIAKSLQDPIDHLTTQRFDSQTKGLTQPYEDIVAKYHNEEYYLLRFVFRVADQEKQPLNAFDEYTRHGDVSRLLADVQADMKAGKLDYIKMPADWVVTTLQLFVEARAARDLQAMLSTNKSLTDIYASMKQSISEQQTNARPTPSDKQLLSIMDMLMHAYNKNVDKTKPMDAVMYLNGRIGTGKTTMMGVLLRTLAKMEQKDAAKMTMLAGDTSRVGANLEKVIAMSQTAGKGNSIQDIISYLKDPATSPITPAALRFIVVDEAAREYKEVPALAEALNDYNNKNKSDVRLFLLGDIFQVTGELASEDRITAIPELRLATPLTSAFRGKVPPINAAASTFLNAANKDLRHRPLTFTANVVHPWDPAEVRAQNGMLFGVSGSASELSRPEQIQLTLRVLANRKGISIKGNPIDKVIITNKGKVAEWEAAIPADMKEEVKVLNYLDAQGETFDEVYLDLDIDPTDDKIRSTKLLNTAIYTAARSRSFLYLVNNVVNTKEDASLEGRYHSNINTLNELSEHQYNKIDGISAYLNKITPASIRETKKATPKKAAVKPLTLVELEAIPFDKRTDEQHAEFIRQKMVKAFTSRKNITQEQAYAAIALMQARARAANPDNPDVWYRTIEDVGEGKFKMTPDSILQQKEGETVKGAIELLDNGRKVIHALENADFSTAIHELAHVFEDELPDTDKAAILKWTGQEKWDRTTSEKFARAFERYLYDGNAPTAELKSIFQKALEWLRSIYKTLTGSPIDIDINPEVKDVFDKLFEAPVKETIPAAETITAQTAADEIKDEEPPEDAPTVIEAEEELVEGEKPTIDDPYNDYSPVQEGEQGDRELPVNEKRDEDPVTQMGTTLFVGPDRILRMRLLYPTVAALRRYNNINYTDEYGNKVEDRPAVNDKIYAVPMPGRPGQVKYGIFRYTGVEGIHQLLGVLSDIEVAHLEKITPAFAEYNKVIAAENDDPDMVEQGGRFGMQALDDGDYERIAPDGEKNTFYEFRIAARDGRSGFEDVDSMQLPAYLRGTIIEQAELAYNTDPSLEKSVANPNAAHNGVDWLKAENLTGSATGIEPSLLELWYNTMFPTDDKGDFIIPDSPTYDRLKKQATITIQTIDDERYRKLTEVIDGVEPPYSPKTVPVNKGGTYMRIENIPGYNKPQFIPLQGAILNRNVPLHNTLYIDPIQKFLGLTQDYTRRLENFIYDTMGQDPAEFEKLWRGNKYTLRIKDLSGNVIDSLIFRRDDPDAFDLSSGVFRDLARRLINMDWINTAELDQKKLSAVRQNELGDNEDLNDEFVDQLVSFYNQFFDTLRKEGKDTELSAAARAMREAYKVQDTQLDDNNEAELVTYSDGSQEQMWNLHKTKTRGTKTGETKAQVAFTNLAQANGFITDPKTGKKISIARFRTEKKGKKEMGRKNRPIREAYDLLANVFVNTKMWKTIGGIKRQEPDRFFVTFAHAAQQGLYPDKDPLHVNVYQLKQLMEFVIGRNAHTKYYQSVIASDPSFERFATSNLDGIYREVVAEETGKSKEPGASDLFGTLIAHVMEHYLPTAMSTEQLQNVFGDTGYGADGKNMNNLRVNVPMRLSKTGGEESTVLTRWESPANPSSPIPLVRATPEERIGQMVSSSFTGVTATNIGIQLNAHVGEEHITPSQPTVEDMTPHPGEDPKPFVTGDNTSTPGIQPEEPTLTEGEIPETEAEKAGDGPELTKSEEAEGDIGLSFNHDIYKMDDPDDKNFFSGVPAGEKLDHPGALKYLKKMIPGLTPQQMNFLDKLNFLRKHGREAHGATYNSKGPFSAIFNGAIDFMSGEANDIYKNVIKHEAFHAIFKYFTSPQKRDRVLNAAIHYYGLKDTSPKEVEEFLAGKFHEKEDEAWLPSLIRSFFNWVRRMFGLISDHQYTIEQYFRKIERGEFVDPTEQPLTDTSFMTKFAQHYDNDPRLFNTAWVHFAHSFQRFRLEGHIVERPDGTEIKVPLGDNEILMRVAGQFTLRNRLLSDKTNYTQLTATQRKQLNIDNQEDFDLLKRVYAQMSKEEVFKDMVDAHYPDRFNINRKKSVEEKEEGEAGDEQNEAKENEEDEQTKVKSIAEELEDESRYDENVNLDASIKSDNDLDPRSTISDMVYMYLHSIYTQGTKDGEKPIPVDTESSFYYLYNAIHNIPLDATDEEGRANERKVLLQMLTEGFGRFVKMKGKKARKRILNAEGRLEKAAIDYPQLDNVKQEKLVDKILDDVLEVKNYYQMRAEEHPSPNIRYSMQAAVDSIGIIHDNLKKETNDIADKKQRDAFVKRNLDWVKNAIGDMILSEAEGNPKAVALYDSLRRLVIDAYAKTYVVPGRAPVKFRGHLAFHTDDHFMYHEHHIRRITVIDKLTKTDPKTGKQVTVTEKRKQTNLEYMNSIVSFIKSRNHKLDNEDAKLDLEDIIAIWRRRKAYNTLDDIMAIVNNSYLTSPYRFRIEEKDNRATYKMRPITNDDLNESFAREIMNAVGNHIRYTDEEGIVRFNPKALSGTFHKVADKATQEDIVRMFYRETIGGERPDLSFSADRLEKAYEGVTDILDRVSDIIKSQTGNAEEFDIEEDLYDEVRKFTRQAAAPLVDTQTDRNLSGYKNGNKDYVSGIRKLSFADRVLANIRRYTDSRKTEPDKSILRSMEPFLQNVVQMDARQSIFWQLNPLNPFAMIDKSRLQIGDARLFDSHLSIDYLRREWSTAYDQESRKDVMGRLFTGNYLTAINHPTLFPVKESDNRKRVYTVQPFYIMEQKYRSQGSDMELIPSGENTRRYYAQILFQIMNRPLPSYTHTIRDRNGNVIRTVQPYKNQKYDPYYSPFTSIKGGKEKNKTKSEMHLLREAWEDEIQRVLGESNLKKDTGQLNDLFDRFMKDTTVQEYLSRIEKEMQTDARTSAAFIIKSMEHNSAYKRQDRGVNIGSIQQQPYRALAFKLIAEGQLKTAYDRLLAHGVIDKAHIEKYSNGLITVEENDTVKLHGYSADVFNSNIEAGHLMPLLMNFTDNYFINSHFLGQITMDDASVYNDQAAIIKRMAIAHAAGYAFFNMNNVLSEPQRENWMPDALNIVVIQDVNRYRNLNRTITNENYKPELYNDPLDINKITVEEAREIVEKLDQMSQLSQPQFDNMLLAYSKLYQAGEAIEDLSNKFRKLNLSKNLVNDAAGWTTQRAQNRFMRVSGPGRNIQDIMKPSSIGRDMYGVARPARFSTETITDRMASQQPALFELRFDVDFGYLNRDGETPDGKKFRDLYKQAYDLEKKRVDLITKSADPNRPPLLSAEEEDILNKIYNSPHHRPGHVIVPESAVKFNCPDREGIGKYNYLTEQFQPINHDTASYVISMKDFRIQQDPVTDPNASSVALWSQLMYMVNTNGNNPQEMEQLYQKYSEIQKLGMDELLENYPLETAPANMATATLIRDNSRSMVSMLEKVAKDSPAKQQDIEMLKKSVSGVQDPGQSDGIFTQFMSFIKRITSGHRFPGMKLVQLTPLLRRVAVRATESEGFQSTGFKEPKYDQDTMTAEVYLPDTIMRRMRKIKGYEKLTTEELIARIPITFGFRVPSTGLNSAIRIKVIGFYPPTFGGKTVNTIIGPSDMHLIMGSDFDIDSLFVIDPNYARQDIKKKLFKEVLNNIYRVLYGKEYDGNPIGFNTVKTDAGYELMPLERFEEEIKTLYYQSPGNTSTEKKLRKIYRKIYTAYLDNSMLHQYVKVLAKESNKGDVSRPISFDLAKDTTSKESLFNQRAFALSPAYKKAWEEADKHGRMLFDSKFKSQMETERDKVLNKGYNVNTPTGTMLIHQESMGSAKLIGIEANATKTTAYNIAALDDPKKGMWLTDGKFDTQDLTFTYDGDKRDRIGELNEQTGKYEIILDNDAGSIFQTFDWITNGVLDAMKEGIPAVMNLTRFTANAWTGAMLTKMNSLKVQSFMNLPVVRDVSDSPTSRGNIRESVYYFAQRKLLTLLKIDDDPEVPTIRQIRDATDPQAKAKLIQARRDAIREVYEEYDAMRSENKDYFKSEVEGYLKAKMTHAQTQAYEKYTSIDEATDPTDEDTAPLTGDELSAFVRYNLTALDTFRKMDEIGNGFFQLQMATGIIKNAPVKYHEVMDYLETVYKIFDNKKTKMRIADPTDSEQDDAQRDTYTGKLMIRDEKGNMQEAGPNDTPTVRKGFPIQGVNLFNIPHFKQAFRNYMYGLDGARNTILKHHPVIENMAIAIQKKFNIKASQGKRITELIENIKDGIVGYMFGLIDFTNSDSTTTSMSATNYRNKKGESFYERNSGMRFYGAQAFMQEFIDDVEKLRSKEMYQKSTFMGRLKIETGRGGVKSLGVRKLSGLNENYIEAFRKDFEMLDWQERQSRDSSRDAPDTYWYSPLQIKFLKYAVLDSQLKNSPYNFSRLLPTDMRINLMDAMFKTITTFMPAKSTTISTGLDAVEFNTSINIMENTLVNQIFENVGLKIVFNNSNSIPDIKYKDTDAYRKKMDRIEYELATGTQSEQESEPFFSLDRYTFNNRNVYAHARLTTKNSKKTIDEEYPLIVKNRSYFNRSRSEVFIRIDAGQYDETDRTTGATTKIYTAFYTRVGYVDNLRSMLANKDVMYYGYSIKEMFPADWPRYYERDMMKSGELMSELDLTNDSYVMVTKDGDAANEFAKVYRVVEQTKDNNRNGIEAFNERLRETVEKKGRYGDRMEKRMQLYRERSQYYGRYRLEEVNPGEVGTKAVKLARGTFNAELMKLEQNKAEIEAQLLDRSKDVSLVLQEQGIDNMVVTNAEATVIAEAIITDNAQC
jgi:hypothetical protein